MVEIKGMKELVTKLKKFGKEGEQRIHDTTQNTAEEIRLDAVSLAPYDHGRLRNSMYKEQIGDLSYKIATNVEYAPYMEFGTGGMVDLSYLTQAGYPSSEAAQFKGASQERVHLQPQPFLYPAFIINRLQYIEDLKNDLEDLTNGI